MPSSSAIPPGIFLLSPPVLFVAQQLVDVIGQVLDCQDVSLCGFAPGAGRVYYMVGSGFTPEQEQDRRETSGYFLPSDFVDETVLTRWAAGQDVVLTSDRLRRTPGYRADGDVKQFLGIPLFLEQRLALLSSPRLVLTRGTRRRRSSSSKPSQPRPCWSSTVSTACLNRSRRAPEHWRSKN